MIPQLGKLKAYTTLALALTSSLSGASFYSFDQGASSLGFAHADMASLAEDATTNWYNTAGITRFNCPEFSVGAINVRYDTSLFSSITFQGDNFIDLQKAIDIYSPILALLQSFSANESVNFVIPKAKGDTSRVHGFLHMIYPLIKGYGPLDIAFGISATSPWNFESDYTGTNLVSYAKKTEISSYSIAPSIAIRAYKTLSIGFQPRWQRFSFYQSSDQERLLGVDYSLRDYFFGYNFSTLFEVTSYFRMGATFDLNKAHTLYGTANLLVDSFKAKAKFHLPNVLTLGATWEPCWNIAWTATFAASYWSKFKTVKYYVKNEQGLNVMATALPFNFKDTYLSALGIRYLANESLTFRAGISYETDATRNLYREIKFHDARKYGIAVGINYAFNTHFSCDFGYMFTYCPTNGIQENPFTDYNPYALANLVGINNPPSQFPIISPTINENSGLFNGSGKTLINTLGIQLNGRF